MTITELRELAQWHQTKADLRSMRLRDERDAGLSHAEQTKARELIAFHQSAANGLKALASAFSTLSALSTHTPTV